MSVYQINIHNNEVSCNLKTRDINLIDLKLLIDDLVSSNDLLDIINYKIRNGSILIAPPKFASGYIIVLRSAKRDFEIRDYNQVLIDFGDLFTFVNKAKKIFSENKFLQYVDKVVSFKYNGGSNPKKKRIVRVEEVDNEHLKGKDVEKDEIRNYLISKIDVTSLVVLSE